jgi:hypothetical protein
MFASCHFGSCIDAASANYESGRHIAYAMGKRAGQAPVLKRPAAKMCSQPRASSGVSANNDSVKDAQGVASGGNALGAAVAELSKLNMRQLRIRATSLGVARRDERKRQKRRNQLEEDCRLALEAQQSECTVAELSELSMGQLRARATSLGVAHRDESKRKKRRNQLEEDCRLALEAQQSEVQQEGRRSGSALDVGGSSFEEASSPSAAPAGGQEAERTKTVPGYSGTSMHTASTATTSEARRLAIGGNALGAAVAELSELSMGQLKIRATSLGVAQRDESKTKKTKNRLEGDCRRALEDNAALGAAVAELSALKQHQLFKRATSLGVVHRDESKRRKTRNQLTGVCRRALEAQQYSKNQMRLYCARLCWRIRYCGCEPAGV